MNTLRQSKLRVDRAQKKLTALERLVERTRKDAFKTTAEQADLNTTQPLSQFLGDIWDEGRLLISEFAFHARVALDYIVFALARRDTGVEQERTQFPINDCPENFVRNRNRNGCLEYLTIEHAAMIESFQPYNGIRLRPLALLHTFSNSDKHKQFVRITVDRHIVQDSVLQANPLPLASPR